MSDGNKKVTYDRVVTGFQVTQGGRFALTIRYENSETGENRREVSAKTFSTQSAAEEAADALARELQAKLRGS